MRVGSPAFGLQMVFCLAVCVLGSLLFSACLFDPSGAFAQQPDGALPGDGAVDRFTSRDGLVEAGQADGTTDTQTPLCEEGRFVCEADSTARVCRNQKWKEVGDCFLGCDEDARACRVPSNVDVTGLSLGATPLAEVEFPEDAHIEVDTDDGRIWDATHSEEIRPSSQDSIVNGIGFFRRSQPGAAPTLGIFVVTGLYVPATTTVSVQGNNAFVLLAAADVSIFGVLDAGAQGAAAGPGGGAGGAVGLPGLGLCFGQPGQAAPSCSKGCASGSGGGGFGASGGAGGPVDCDGVQRAGGLGGGPCGQAALVPLIGGSGGGGGVPIQTMQSSDPGLGGGGGGAVQISARESIAVGNGGGIDVPGDGGGQTITGGGSGGGSGGAILLESTQIVLYQEAFLTANGGGGGGGDCS